MILCALCCRPAMYQGATITYERMRTNVPMVGFVRINGEAKRVCVDCDERYSVGYGLLEIRYRHVNDCPSCREVFCAVVGLSEPRVIHWLRDRAWAEPAMLVY